MMKRDDKDSEIQSQNTTYFAENEEAQYCPLSPSIWGHRMFDEMSDFSNLRKREIKRLFKNWKNAADPQTLLNKAILYKL